MICLVCSHLLPKLDIRGIPVLPWLVKYLTFDIMQKVSIPSGLSAEKICSSRWMISWNSSMYHCTNRKNMKGTNKIPKQLRWELSQNAPRQNNIQNCPSSFPFGLPGACIDGDGKADHIRSCRPDDESQQHDDCHTHRIHVWYIAKCR